MRAQMAKAEKKRQKEGYYKTGEGFNICIPVKTTAACRHCGQAGHKTMQSRLCTNNILNQKRKVEALLEERKKQIETANKELE